MTSIVCLGDSLTAGHPGRSYVRVLGRSFRCVNRGLGGATLATFLARDPADSLPAEARVILELGANDLLLPYMHATRPRWRDFIEDLYRNGCSPAPDLEVFEGSYRRLATRLKELDASLLCLSLPLLGEEPESELNLRVAEYNRVVELIARELGAGFLDFFSWQRNAAGGSPYLLGEEPDSLRADAVELRDEGNETAACRARGLEISVDGVHLNLRGASALAALIGERLAGHGEEWRSYAILD